MTISNTNANVKSGINPIPVQKYVISANDVADYLMKTFGFEIKYDFTRWTGVTPEFSYVRMRVLFKPSDICTSAKDKSNYVDKILAENASGIMFKDNVIKELKPFMYPETIANVVSDPAVATRLAQRGVYGENLKDLIVNSVLNYSRDADVFKVVLQPEKIIVDMLSDPATGEPDGELVITAVEGSSAETIRWQVEVSKINSFSSANDISIDQIFAPSFR